MFTHSSVNGHLGCLHLLLIVKNYCCIHRCAGNCASNFGGSTLRRRIAGSYGNSMFNLLGNCQTVFLYYGHIKINLFLAALGLCCCAQALSSCGEQGLLFIVAHGLLIAMASFVAEHGQ